MGLKGFRCPPGTPTIGTVNPIEHCLTTCPHQCAAPALLAAIYKTDQDNHHVGQYISASMLTGTLCPRQTVLERTHDFYEIPMKRYWSFRGTLAHSLIERSVDLLAPYGWISEMRMQIALTYEDQPAPIFKDGQFTGEYDESKPLTFDIGGTCDSYNPKTLTLWDMKSMADVKAEMMITSSKPGTYSKNLDDAWVKQLNIYRWLISKTLTSKELKQKFKLKGKFLPAPEYLGIQGISMMNLPRTGQPYAMTKSHKTNIFNIDPVPVWSLEDTEKFVKEEALKWYRWLVLKEPTPVVPEKLNWLCTGCAFNGERLADGICFPNQERKQQKQEDTLLLLLE